MRIIDFLRKVSWMLSRRSASCSSLLTHLICSFSWFHGITVIQNVRCIVSIIHTWMVNCFGCENWVHLYILVWMRWDRRRLHHYIVRQFWHLYYLILWISRLLVSTNHETNNKAYNKTEHNDTCKSTNYSCNWYVFTAWSTIFLNV